MYVGPWRGLGRGMGFVAQACRRFFQFTRALGQPVLPVQPPRVGVLVGVLLPLLGAGWHFAAGHVARFGIAWRVEDALDMTAVGQHELDIATKQLG
ncbi:hypothetical protein D3C72_1933480 [compost metagenome]